MTSENGWLAAWAGRGRGDDLPGRSSSLVPLPAYFY